MQVVCSISKKKKKKNSITLSVLILELSLASFLNLLLYLGKHYI